MSKKEKDPYSLREIYKEMELELIASMRRNFLKHKMEEHEAGFSWEMWQKAKLRNIRQYHLENSSIIYRFKARIKQAIKDVLNHFYDKGYRSTINVPEDGKNTAQPGQRPPKENQFFGVNKKKLDALIKTSQKDFDNANHAVYRKMDDIYRQTIFKTEFQLSSGALSLGKAIDNAVDDFLDKGINCIGYKDKTGQIIRYVNIADYAEMALRTASHRARLLGEGAKRDELGIHLVFVSAHANACKLCLPWQGQILIDDVFSHPSDEYIARYKDKYKLLSDAIKAGLLHPNCRHTLATYFEGVTRLPKPQDENKALENYNNEQHQRKLEREIRKRKRILAGVVDEDDIKEAQRNLKTAQKKLRDFLEEHPEFKRQYRREKIYGTNEKITVLDKKSFLNKTEEGAIIRYISPDAYILNDKLRNGYDLSDDDKTWINNLDKALDKLPIYKGTVARSLEFYFSEDKEIFLSRHVVGKEINYGQYLSSSVEGAYNENEDVKLIINSKTGCDMRKYNPDENEVLFKRDVIFKIIDIDKESSKTLITLEEVEKDVR